MEYLDITQIVKIPAKHIDRFVGLNEEGVQVSDLKEYFQKKLVSGKTIKTINGESILGEGNIDIQVKDVYTKSESDEKFQPKGDYLIKSDLDDYYTKTEVDDAISKIDISEDLSKLEDKINSELDKKQDVLESGVNIKTINDQSLLGYGNLTLEGIATPVIDNLESNSTTSALSANQGKVLNEKINSIEEVIPEQASKENKLADKDFVNSSIATNTANFIGTFDNLDELKSKQATNNDYAYLVIYDEVSKQVKQYDRYKYSNNNWIFEYTLNNSSFTAAQWDAINSGITSGTIIEINDKITNNTSDITTIKSEIVNKADKDSVINDVKLENKVLSKTNSQGTFEITTFGDNAFNSTPIPTDLGDLTNEANYPTRGEFEDALGEIAELEADKANKTDVYTKEEVEANFGRIEEQQSLRADVENALGDIAALEIDKQDKLISGTNIKTINGESILGEGDITISSSSKVYYIIYQDTNAEELQEINSLFQSGVTPEIYIKDTTIEGFQGYNRVVRYNVGLNFVTLYIAKYFKATPAVGGGANICQIGYMITGSSFIKTSDSVNPMIKLTTSDEKYFNVDSTTGLGNNIILSPKTSDIESATESSGLATAYDVKNYVDSHSGGEGVETYYLTDANTEESITNGKKLFEYIQNGVKDWNTFTLPKVIIRSAPYTYEATIINLSGSISSSSYITLVIQNYSTDNSPKIYQITYRLTSDGEITRQTSGNSVSVVKFDTTDTIEFQGTNNGWIKANVKTTDINNPDDVGFATAKQTKEYIDSHSSSGDSKVYHIDMQSKNTEELKELYNLMQSGTIPEIYIKDVEISGSIEYKVIKYTIGATYIDLGLTAYRNESFTEDVVYVSSVWYSLTETDITKFINSSDPILRISADDNYLNVEDSAGTVNIKAKTSDIETATEDSGLATAYDVKNYVDSHSGGEGSKAIILTPGNSDENKKFRDIVKNENRLPEAFVQSGDSLEKVIRVKTNTSGSPFIVFTGRISANPYENKIYLGSSYYLEGDRLYFQNYLNADYINFKNYLGVSSSSGIPTINVKQSNLETVTSKGEGLADAYDVKEYITNHSGGYTKEEADEKFASKEELTSINDNKQNRLTGNYIKALQPNGGYIQVTSKGFNGGEETSTIDFKTVNGQSIFGQGDISVSGGGSSNVYVLEVSNEDNANNKAIYDKLLANENIPILIRSENNLYSAGFINKTTVNWKVVFRIYTTEQQMYQDSADFVWNSTQFEVNETGQCWMYKGNYGPIKLYGSNGISHKYSSGNHYITLSTVDINSATNNNSYATAYNTKQYIDNIVGDIETLLSAI